MRGQTRAPGPATTHLSALWCESKHWPLAREVLLRRRLTPLEVVWRSSDPPVHYMPITCACGESERVGSILVWSDWGFILSPPVRQPRRCKFSSASQRIVWGDEAKPSVFSMAGGFAV